MTNNSSSELSEQAAAWASRLENDPLTDQEREQFLAWVSNPVNERAYLEQVQIAELAREVRLRSNTPGIGVVAANNELASPSGLRARGASKAFRYAAAAAALLIAAGIAWFLIPTQPRTLSFSTATREVRTVDFEDGSTATMNTRSELIWIGSSNDRRVLLRKGEALFDVSPDVKRPFRVLVGDLDEIRVVGTHFNVYRKSEGTIIVSVLKGTVEVIHRDNKARVIWSRHVSAEQQLQYQPTGAPVVRTARASKAVRWTEGELDMDETPLPEVVAELGRYTDERIVLVPDKRLEQTYVGGVLSVQNIDAALALLQKRAPVSITRTGRSGEYMLSYRDQPLSPIETARQ